MQERGAFDLVDADSVQASEREDIDLALVSLALPTQFKSEPVPIVRQYLEHGISVGDRVEAYGFRGVQLAFEARPLEIIAVHGAVRAFVCMPHVADGFSGGPVFSDGNFVGTLFASNLKDNVSFFHSGKAILDTLARVNANAVRWVEESPHILRRYPLGPRVDSTVVFAKLQGLMRAAASLFQGHDAILMVGRANAERMTCGPPTGAAGIIETGYLPSPQSDLRGFWTEAFRIAGNKSPRMLAALLLQLIPDTLDKPERLQMEKFFDVLARWEDPMGGM